MVSPHLCYFPPVTVEISGHRALVIVVPALEDIHGDAQFFGLAMVRWWKKMWTDGGKHLDQDEWNRMTITLPQMIDPF